MRAEELPVAERPISYDEVAAVQRQESMEVTGALSRELPGTGNHARVPRPMGIDFMMLPTASAQELPSKKYAKDLTKGRLQDRILNGKKKASSQAVTLSVEGRTLDKFV